MIFGQPIYVYSRKILVDILPYGYSDPSGIPHNVKKATDLNGNEDVPLPSDNSMDVDSSTSNSRPARRRAPTASTFTSIESYL